MAHQWKEVTLDEIADLTVGFVGETATHYVDEGVRFIRSMNVEPFYINNNDPKFINQEFHNRIKKSELNTGDVVIVRTGKPGACAVIPPKTDEWNCADLVVVKPKHGYVNSAYLAAFINLAYGVINAHLVGAVQQHFNVGSAKKLKIKLPSMDVQNKVGRFIDNINEKIETNKEINENLEQQAQAYFDELFVVNADPNWPECTLSDIGTVVAGGTPSKSKVEYYADHGIAWITPKDLSVDKSKFISHGENDISELGFSKSSAAKMPAGTVLFSSRAPIGYIAIAQNEVTTNQGFKSVIPNENIGTAYVYFLLKNLLPTIEGMASGSTFKEISGAGMKSVPTVMPDADTIQLFSTFCEPVFKEQEVLEAENKHLSALRDSLLPKLMSGEIDVTTLKI